MSSESIASGSVPGLTTMRRKPVPIEKEIEV